MEKRGCKQGEKDGGWERITRTKNTVFIWFHQKDKLGCQTQSQAVFLGSHYHLPDP